MNSTRSCLLLLVGILLIGVNKAGAAWLREGTPVAAASGNQDRHVLVGDGSGGAFLSWSDQRSGVRLLYVQHVDADGEPTWAVDGIRVTTSTIQQSDSALLPDGSGGVFVIWNESSGPGMHAQRLDSDGHCLWAPAGVALTSSTSYCSNPCIVADGAGGAIVAWRNSSWIIQAQGIDADGNLLVPPLGVVVCNYSANDYPRLVSDGSGGAIVVFQQNLGAYYLKARRMDAAGNMQWDSGGVQIGQTSTIDGTYSTVTDAQGGAIVAWWFGADVRAQRIDGSGALLWTSGGVAVCPDTDGESDPMLVADGQGGAFIAWEDSRSEGVDLYAQHLRSNGSSIWPRAGMPVCTEPSTQNPMVVASDLCGGLLIAWFDYTGTTQLGLYAQRLDSAGQQLWDRRGARVCTQGNAYYPQAASGSPGSLIVAWQDYRGADYDIYAQRIDPSGYWVNPAPVIAAVRDLPGDQGGQVLLSWQASALEMPPDLTVTSYSLWRALPVMETKASPPDAELVSAIPLAATNGEDTAPLWRQDLGDEIYYWEMVGSQSAYYMEGYAQPLPTYFDSTATTPGLHWFQVVAHTAVPTLFWASSPASARSVDNLAPAAPLLLEAAQSYAPLGLSIVWRSNREADLARYELHRGETPGFIPTPDNLVAAQADTAYFDAAWELGPHYYKLFAIDVHENRSDAALLDPALVTGIGDRPAVRTVTLAQNAPNPFNPRTSLAFSLPTAGHASLRIYDAAGRLVRTLVDGWCEAGPQTIVWDGTDARGGEVASGVYLYRLEADGWILSRRMVLVR